MLKRSLRLTAVFFFILGFIAIGMPLTRSAAESIIPEVVIAPKAVVSAALSHAAAYDDCEENDDCCYEECCYEEECEELVYPNITISAECNEVSNTVDFILTNTAEDMKYDGAYSVNDDNNPLNFLLLSGGSMTIGSGTASARIIIAYFSGYDLIINGDTLDCESTPTPEPTANPTEVVTQEPTQNPTSEPTLNPTEVVTQQPTQNPTSEPTLNPTDVVTQPATEVATQIVTPVITAAPTIATDTCGDGIYQAELITDAQLFWAKNDNNGSIYVLPAGKHVTIVEDPANGFVRIRWSCQLYYIRAATIGVNPDTITKPFPPVQ